MVNPVVQDRFYLSEAAYSVAARREPRLGTRELDLLDAELRVRGGFTVLLLAHDEVLEELYARKTQPELFELDVIRRANAMFRGLAQRTQHVYTLGSYPDYDEARRIVDEYVTWQDYVRETWKRDTRRSS